ncbi:type III effector HrpK domain-containing protein [Erwinia mallotivora]|uniref:Type III effector HrpK n=1 Tax=Erwinia mallotivora TaxID=69222 RepID=A0A014MCJ6_9GAMM|nr:type III effector HrpK domain-containing protein [Erwinia mallotivora]EXU75794.1 type III effector HrpK [Erwinia mallotivora]
MRVSSTPSSFSQNSLISPETTSQQTAVKTPAGQNIQFGAMPGMQQDVAVALTLSGMIRSILQAVVAQRGDAAKAPAALRQAPQGSTPAAPGKTSQTTSTANPSAGAVAGSTTATAPTTTAAGSTDEAPTATAAAPAQPTSTVSAPAAPTSGQTTSASGQVASADHSGDFLDNSPLSSPDKLKKWEPMVANLPADQRLQAEKELNRPMAAAQMVLDGGPDAQRAQAYIDANPALKNAIDAGKHGDNPDGKVTKDDYKGFISRMNKAQDAADKDISDYLKKNPNADEGSRQMVAEAAMLRANGPILRVAGLENGKAGKDMSADDLNNLVKQNPGLSGSLRQAARSFSSPGLLAELDQGGVTGKKLAEHGPDSRFSNKNIDNWIKKQAPTNGGDFAQLINQAALVNATANVDTSRLNKDVFDHPDKYSGAEKAAVMVKLQQTLKTVQAGRSLRNTTKTEQALNEKIDQLQKDPAVNTYLNKAVPAQSKALINGDKGLRQALDQRYGEVASGKTLSDDMQRIQAGQKDKKSAPDYSDALQGLTDELSLQHSLRGDSVPTAKEVVARQPGLSEQLNTSFQQQIAQGGYVKDNIKGKHADAQQILQLSDMKKSLYESVLPKEVTNLKQDGYTEAVMDSLKVGKRGVDMLKTLKQAGLLSGDVKKMSGKEMLSSVDKALNKDGPATGMKGLMKTGMSSAAGVAGLFSVSSMLASGNKAGAAKAIYDGVHGSSELAKLGVDTALKSTGREATASFGRMAGMAAGRAVGMVAGEGTAMAAASTIGAAAGPVGWVVDGAIAIGFGISSIVSAVNKHKEQKRFDHNVDPVLDQFGIPKAH